MPRSAKPNTKVSSDGPRLPSQSDTTRLIGRDASDEEKGDPPLFTPADRIFNAGCLFYVLLWVIFMVLMPALITALAVFVPATRDGAFVNPFVESFEQIFGDPPPLYDLSSPPESLLLLAGFAATAGFLGLVVASFSGVMVRDGRPNRRRWGAIASLLGLAAGIFALLVA